MPPTNAQKVALNPKLRYPKRRSPMQVRSVLVCLATVLPQPPLHPASGMMQEGYSALPCSTPLRSSLPSTMHAPRARRLPHSPGLVISPFDSSSLARLKGVSAISWLFFNFALALLHRAASPLRLPKLPHGERPPALRQQLEMLIRRALRIIVQPLDRAIAAP